jgi:hypothetical protein
LSAFVLELLRCMLLLLEMGGNGGKSPDPSSPLEQEEIV